MSPLTQGLRYRAACDDSDINLKHNCQLCKSMCWLCCYICVMIWCIFSSARLASQVADLLRLAVVLDVHYCHEVKFSNTSNNNVHRLMPINTGKLSTGIFVICLYFSSHQMKIIYQALHRSLHKGLWFIMNIQQHNKISATGQCRKLYHPDLDTRSYWYPR